MRVIVPDASVLLKWVLPAEAEEYMEQALSIRDAFENAQVHLTLPSLWFFEVGKILTIKCPEDAARRLESVVRMRIPEARPNARWRDRIVDLVSSHRVTFYDASYHALAMINDGAFVTADQRYLDKAGAGSNIMHLGDWRLPE